MTRNNIGFAILFSTIFVVFYVYHFAAQGRIIFERPYLNEYTQCKADLKQAQVAVQCPEVKCNCGSSGIVWTIVGGIFGLAGYVMYFFTMNKLNKLLEKK
jgi:hypothetical protein